MGISQKPAGERLVRWLTRRGWLPCVAAAVLVAACGDTETSPSSVEELHGAWQLVAILGQDGTDVRPANPAAYTAEFTPDGGLRLNADCNVCNGSYGTVDSSISISPLGCTRAYCFSAPLDTDYISALQAATHVATADGKLVLRTPDATLTFRR